MLPIRKLSYERTVLYGNDYFEIVACEWNRDSLSARHNHGWSQCMVLVEEGRFENRANFALKEEVQIVERGGVIETPKGVEHEIRCLADFGKTLHVYVPKIHARTESGRFNTPSLSEMRNQLDLSLGKVASSWETIELLFHKIRELSIATHSPYFMNQLFSGIFSETLAAEALVAETKTTIATYEASPAFTAIELELVEKLCALIAWKRGESDGIAVPGGSAANFMAIHCARQFKFPQAKAQGVQAKALKIFVSEAAHYSMKKACAVLGLGTEALVTIATDTRGRMSVSALAQAISSSKAKGEVPLLVCATAGTTVLGAFDPINSIADICELEHIWLHVDGAWGGPVLFSQQNRMLVDGIERADSVAFDAHKLFGAALTSSYFVHRHRDLLLQANDVADGDYLFHTEDSVLDRGRLSWQCGRGADSLSFWTLWKNNGSDGLGRFVDRLFEVRDQSLIWIRKQPRLQLIAEPDYLNICVRISHPDDETQNAEWSKKVREKLKQDNLAMVNFASNQEGTFLRLILANPKISFEHIEQILLKAIEVRE